MQVKIGSSRLGRASLGAAPFGEGEGEGEDTGTGEESGTGERTGMSEHTGAGGEAPLPR